MSRGLGDVYKRQTVHTLEWLRGQDPDGALYLCVGSDMLLTFQEWYRWQDMLKMAALVVESRTGTDEAALHAAAQLLANCNSRAALAIFSGRASIV